MIIFYYTFFKFCYFVNIIFQIKCDGTCDSMKDFFENLDKKLLNKRDTKTCKNN